MSDKQNQEVSNEEIIDQVAEEVLGTEEADNGDPNEAAGVQGAEVEENEGAESGDKEGEESVSEEPVTIDGLEIPKPDLEDDEVPDIKKQRSAWAELRIKERELKRKEEEKRIELEKRQAEIARLEAQNAVAQIANKAPNRDDFADDAEYHEAMVAFTLAKQQVQINVEANARQRLAAQQKLHDGIEEIKSKGAAKYSDYDEVVDPLFSPTGGVPANIDFVESIIESKYGDQILYMLGRNKAKCIEIAKLPPKQAMKWVWETERKFEEARAKSKPQAPGIKVMPKVQSKMTNIKEKDIGEMTVKEYAEYWKKSQYGK